ncbi:predicted protein [Plenodomus lingam JN3]|uniref:Predicted protein n=1 Tax=Leptosphaeria maculans (strain JN3 / isolate v23.1.3 / race Av1-4-5-6-7-8) TaxID=985895 RepID=E4ZHU0_LEPMJ|nr:predicted protein [Plenodomus lingam JN3]CBX90923.1 predicted protein [Plenodomus lingam JN3]
MQLEVQSVQYEIIINGQSNVSILTKLLQLLGNSLTPGSCCHLNLHVYTSTTTSFPAVASCMFTRQYTPCMPTLIWNPFSCKLSSQQSVSRTLGHGKRLRLRRPILP